LRYLNLTGFIRSRIVSPLAAAVAAVSLTALLFACNDSAAPVNTFKANSGQIQVLNGSGTPGQADVFRAFLIDQGFDVIESGNARSWSYDHTLVLARSVSDTIARHLASALGTQRVVHLNHPASLVEATVIIGKDYKELMKTWPKSQKQQP
jgi:hypothetical protein